MQHMDTVHTNSNDCPCNTSNNNIRATTTSSTTIPSSSTNEKNQKPRIAIISNFLIGTQSEIQQFTDFDHLINKACYAYIWGYDYIFNMTFGFNYDDDVNGNKAYWLNYGTWHRVPNIRDRIHDYDYILFADIDYIINDITISIESFIKQWELHDIHPSLFVPKDFDDGVYTFSAYTWLIKNDLFGHRLLHHWMNFGRGICPNGNFAASPRPYQWEDGDQSGLWYAMVETHKELYPWYNITTKPLCNITSGLIDSIDYFNEMNDYFDAVQAVLGSGGTDLLNVPKEQPIIWSIPNKESKAGLGMQFKYGIDVELMEDYADHIFAFHHDDINVWSEKSKINLDLCKEVHGCYANYTKDGKIQIGCNGIQYTVATSTQ